MDAESTALFVLSIVTLVLLFAILVVWLVSIVRKPKQSKLKFSEPSPCEKQLKVFLQTFFERLVDYGRAASSYSRTRDSRYITQMAKAENEATVLLRDSKQLPDELKSILETFLIGAKALAESKGNLTPAIDDLFSKQYADFVQFGKKHDSAFNVNDASKVFISIGNDWIQWLAYVLKYGSDDTNARSSLFASLPHFATHLCTTL